MASDKSQGGLPLATCHDSERWVLVPFEVDKKFDGFRIDRFLAQRLRECGLDGTFVTWDRKPTRALPSLFDQAAS